MAIVTAIDHTRTARTVLAFGEGRWGAMAESSLVYDPRLMWNTWLMTHFFDVLRRDLREIRDIDEGLEVVRRAARDAVTLEVPSEHGIPS